MVENDKINKVVKSTHNVVDFSRYRRPKSIGSIEGAEQSNLYGLRVVPFLPNMCDHQKPFVSIISFSELYEKIRQKSQTKPLHWHPVRTFLDIVRVLTIFQNQSLTKTTHLRGFEVSLSF